VAALVRDEQSVDFPTQVRISLTGGIKKRSAPGRIKFQRRLVKRFDFSAGFRGYCHGWRLLNSPRPFLHHAAMPPQLSTSVQGFLSENARPVFQFLFQRSPEQSPRIFAVFPDYYESLR
jgi:hypothetical protein